MTAASAAVTLQDFSTRSSRAWSTSSIPTLDRLTRSLSIRLIDLPDQDGVTFVKVTQSFDTQNSMERLVLNAYSSIHARFADPIVRPREWDQAHETLVSAAPCSVPIEVLREHLSLKGGKTVTSTDIA